MTPISSPLSSPLSSIGSRSPTPPADYPSPPSSNVSDKESPSISRMVRDDLPDFDGPPAKRQKIAKSKELKTEYLDLQKLIESDDEEHHKNQDAKLTRLMEVLRTKRKIVVIAGAGISVSAGIPDFRSSNGLFATLRTQHKLKASGKHLFDASVYRNDSSTSSFHTMVRELSHLTRKAEPTAFHHMLATLAEEGRLLRLYTQNVDGIDTSLDPLATAVPLNLKGPWPKTVQLHGGLEKMVCSKCGHLSKFDGSLFEGPEAPSCKECEEIDGVRQASGLRSHGIGRLRPRMVLYNEFNPDEEAIGAVSHADLKTRPDAVIVVGTSLKVPGIRRLAKELCSVTRGKRGGFTAWINYDSEPVGIEFKDCWDMVVRGECDEVARMVNFPKWNEKDYGEYTLMNNEEVTPTTSRPEVVVKLDRATALQVPAMLTPTDSSREQSPAAFLFGDSLLAASDREDAVREAVDIKPKALGVQAGISRSLPAKTIFGNNVPQKAPVPKAASWKIPDAKKIAKKRGRKPLPTKPTKPANAITAKFAASKTSVKLMDKPVMSLGQPVSPNLSKPTSPSLMRPVSPFDTRNNTNPFHVAARDISPKPVVEIPYKPIGKTISPNSKPSGMGHLID